MEGLDLNDILQKAKQRYHRVRESEGPGADSVDSEETQALLRAKTLVFGWDWHVCEGWMDEVHILLGSSGVGSGLKITMRGV